MFTKRQIILSLVKAAVYVGLIGGFYYYFVGRFLPFPMSAILVGISTLFMLWVVGAFRTALAKFKEANLMQEFLDNPGVDRFRDGEVVTVFGHIKAVDGHSIKDPIFQKDCVYYQYGVYRWGQRRKMDRTESFKDYDYGGSRWTRSYIEFPHGEVYIFDRPTLQGVKKKTYEYNSEHNDIFAQMEGYIKKTDFEDMDMESLSGVSSAYELIRELANDDDGESRHDTRQTMESFDLRTRTIEYELLKDGDQVALVGVWSQEKQGIVSNIEKMPSSVLTKGGPEKAIRATKKEAYKSMRTGILVFLAINAIVGMFVFLIFQSSSGNVRYIESGNGRVVSDEDFRSPER